MLLNFGRTISDAQTEVWMHKITEIHQDNIQVHMKDSQRIIIDH